MYEPLYATLHRWNEPLLPKSRRTEDCSEHWKDQARAPGLSGGVCAAEWTAVAQQLTGIDAEERLCGAEINSIASLLLHNYITQDCGLFFLHSDTPNGQAIAHVLRQYYRAQGHTLVENIKVEDFARPRHLGVSGTKGLRQLARELCKILRERTPAACAINATGGYKAQIAIAVLLGQAIGVPVFYKHELFPEIIAFPPMPVALDFELWMRASGMLFDLVRDLNPAPFQFVCGRVG